MSHFLWRKNVGLITIRRSRNTRDWCEIFLSREIISGATTISSLDINYFFPLYLYEEKSKQENLYEKVNGTRRPNLKKEQIDLIEKSLDLKLVTESKQKGKTNFSPIDLLDYIYAVLHSPFYRKKYQEFLKIDFPRIPYPKSQKIFWRLVKLGSQLRQIHLLESPIAEKFITKYPVSGNNSVEKVHYEAQNESKGRVYINSTQYFESVPLIAWNFYIGGYQPAQKWLKDRKGRKLSFDNVIHYQRMIVALTETDNIMKKINSVKF